MQVLKAESPLDFIYAGVNMSQLVCLYSSYGYKRIKTLYKLPLETCLLF